MSKAQIMQWALEKGGTVAGNLDTVYFSRKKKGRKAEGAAWPLEDLTNQQFDKFQTEIETFLHR